MNNNLLKIVLLKTRAYILLLFFAVNLLMLNTHSGAQNVTITIGHEFTHQETEKEYAKLSSAADTIHTAEHIPAYENQPEKTNQSTNYHADNELEQDEKQGLFQRIFKRRGLMKGLFLVFHVFSVFSFIV